MHPKTILWLRESDGSRKIVKGGFTTEVNSPLPKCSGRLLASGAADASEVLLVRPMMTLLVLLPTTTPAAVIAAELEGIFRGATKQLIQESHRFSSSLPPVQCKLNRKQFAQIPSWYLAQ